MRAVVFQRQRIDDAASREGQARLARKIGNFLRPAQPQRVRATRQHAGLDQPRDVGEAHRTVRDTAVGSGDLDHRLQPEEAPRAGPNNLHIGGLAQESGNRIGA
jgi:hypothetical protein